MKLLAVKVILIHVLGLNGLTAERSLDLFKEVQDVYRTEAGIQLRLVRFESVEAPFSTGSQTLNATDRQQVLNLWEDFVHGRFPKQFSRVDGREGAVFLILLPPLRIGDKFFLDGMGAGECFRKWGGKVAYARVEEINQDGDDRFTVSGIGLGHELGHLLGARHIGTDGIYGELFDFCNIMHPSAYQCGIQTGLMQHFAAQSVNEMRRCLR